jgi:hypothetical protein
MLMLMLMLMLMTLAMALVLIVMLVFIARLTFLNRIVAAIHGSQNIRQVKSQLAAVNLKPGGTLFQVTVLMVVLKVLQVRNYCVGALCYHFTDHGNLIIRLCLTLLNCDRPFRAVTDAGTKPVTHKL